MTVGGGSKIVSQTVSTDASCLPSRRADAAAGGVAAAAGGAARRAAGAGAAAAAPARVGAQRLSLRLSAVGGVGSRPSLKR